MRHADVADLVCSLVVAERSGLELGELPDGGLAGQLLLDLLELAVGHVLVLVELALEDALIHAGLGGAPVAAGRELALAARLGDLLAHHPHPVVGALHVVEAGLLPVGHGLRVADDLQRVFVRPPLLEVSCEELIDGGLADGQLVLVVRLLARLGLLGEDILAAAVKQAVVGGLHHVVHVESAPTGQLFFQLGLLLQPSEEGLLVAIRQHFLADLDVVVEA